MMNALKNTNNNRQVSNVGTLTANNESEFVIMAGAHDDGMNTPLARLAAAIAAPLLALLRSVGFRTVHERDLAIAKQIGARDFNTSGGGGTVRNVMTIDQAHRGDFFRDAPAAQPAQIAPHMFSQSGLMDLVKGRDYLAITHGEGPDAKVTIIINDAVDKTKPTALVIHEEGRRPRVLMERHISRLFQSPHDRIVLGPKVQNQRREDAEGDLYHELQYSSYCSMHSINAVAGRQVLSKSLYDDHLMKQRLENFDPAVISEDEFYLNAPRNPDFEYLYDLDDPLPFDVTAELMAKVLGGQVEQTAQTDPDWLLADVARFETEKQGVIVLSHGHYVAFRKTQSPETGKLEWCMIDSGNHEQRWQNPTRYVQHELQFNAPGRECAAIGWSPAPVVPPVRHLLDM